jgi:ribosomal small subunit protein bTHX
MGKGDKKTKRGKIANKSYGKMRLTPSKVRKARRDKEGIVLTPAVKSVK